MKPWSRFSFLPPALFVAFAALMFARPKLIFGFGGVLLWVLFGLFMAMILYVVGTLSYSRIRGRPPEGVRISYAGGFKQRALVGAGGHNAPIAIREDAAGTSVTDSRWTIVPTIVATASFGPGMVLMYLNSSRGFGPGAPIPMVVIAVLIVGVSCVSFVATLLKYLFRRPRLAIAGSAIRFFRGNTEIMALSKQQIGKIAVRSESYSVSNQVTVPNYILYATLREGDDVSLCVTDKIKQISALEESLALKGYKVDSR
jgi:hypothetical protein